MDGWTRDGDERIRTNEGMWFWMKRFSLLLEAWRVGAGVGARTGPEQGGREGTRGAQV